LGSTSKAKATIAPQPMPAMTPQTIKSRIRLGIDATSGIGERTILMEKAAANGKEQV